MQLYLRLVIPNATVFALSPLNEIKKTLRILIPEFLGLDDLIGRLERY